MEKKLNPLGLDGHILLCKSCSAYRHLVTKCPDSWENMMKWKGRKGNMKSVDQSSKWKILGKIEMSDEAQSDEGDLCNALVAVNVEELASEVTESKKKIEISRECDFQKCGILTCVVSDEPVQPPFQLRNSK